MTSTTSCSTCSDRNHGPTGDLNLRNAAQVAIGRQVAILRAERRPSRGLLPRDGRSPSLRSGLYRSALRLRGPFVTAPLRKGKKELGMTNDLRSRLAIPTQRLEALNGLLLSPGVQVVNEFLAIVAKYGTPEEINRKAAAAGSHEALMKRVRAQTPEFAADLAWLEQERDRGAFITIADYRRQVLGDGAGGQRFDESSAVTLEVSAAQYFPWLIECSRRALAEKTLVPGRFIRVRKMKEQEADGDLT